ncbi:hypothetical protein [Thalassotalea atypica]|uniref:hypothetical protein n=1 Tax=Thalassotalea atypica TaxID=2054316 RepID=UPI0025742B95|nr:hypothetical protein [Thalassotalea atypica]
MAGLLPLGMALLVFRNKSSLFKYFFIAFCLLHVSLTLNSYFEYRKVFTILSTENNKLKVVEGLVQSIEEYNSSIEKVTISNKQFYFHWRANRCIEYKTLSKYLAVGEQIRVTFLPTRAGFRKEDSNLNSNQNISCIFKIEKRT